MLEFHPTLAIAGRIPEALKHAYWVSAARCKAETIPTYSEYGEYLSLHTVLTNDVGLCVYMQELYQSHKPETMTDAITLEKKMLEVALKEFSEMLPMGATYSSQIQKDVRTPSHLGLHGAERRKCTCAD